MRQGLPVMLAISALLHLVFVGAALFHFHRPQGSVDQLAQSTTLSLTVVRPEQELPDLSPSEMSQFSGTDDTDNPSSFSVQINSPYLRKKAAARAAALLTTEANPNAHVRSLPAEAVLSPAIAPHLNSANGVVFLLDVSGSMYEPYAGATRLAFARAELSQRIRALPNGAPFAITIYAQTARISGPLVEANDATREAAVRWIMEDFDCGGGTNLPAGFGLAEQLEPGHLVLLTDGDLNIRLPSLLVFAHQILGPARQGPSLSITAIAPRPETDAVKLLQGLATQQGGSYQEESATGSPELLTSNKAPVATP